MIGGLFKKDAFINIIKIGGWYGETMNFMLQFFKNEEGGYNVKRLKWKKVIRQQNDQGLC